MGERRVHIENEVRYWIRHHPGVVFCIDDIQSDLASKSGTESPRSSIASCLLRLSKNGWDIQKPTRNSYIYMGDKKEPIRPAVPEMFEVVGQSPSGAMLARDENGKLYKVTPFDF